MPTSLDNDVEDVRETQILIDENCSDGELTDDEMTRYKRYIDRDYSSESEPESSNEDIEEIESEEEHEIINEVNDNDSQLYDGSELSVEDFSHLFVIFASKHCLADNAKSSLLELFQLVLPDENKVPSLFKLQKLVGPIGNSPTHHNLCSKCHSNLEGDNICYNRDCSLFQTKLKEKNRLTYYVFDIEASVKNLITGEYQHYFFPSPF